MPEFADTRPDDARALVEAFLGRLPGGGWLSPAEADELLRCYGIPVVDSRYVTGAGEAVEAAGALGGHVALKADVPGVVHKSDAGAVELDLRGRPRCAAPCGGWKEGSATVCPGFSSRP